MQEWHNQIGDMHASQSVGRLADSGFYRLRNQLCYMGDHRLPGGPGSYIMWRQVVREVAIDHQESALQNGTALFIWQPLADRLPD